MISNPNLSQFAKGFRPGTLPRLVNTYLIDEEYSSRHARLMHMHKHKLELYFVYSGSGEYIVNSHVYNVKPGDMIICNATVLHGEEPSRPHSVCSYCIGLTDVFLNGLPENHLIFENEPAVISMGALVEQVGVMMRLIHLLYTSLQDNLQKVCQYTALSVLLIVLNILEHRKMSLDDLPALPEDTLAGQIQDYLNKHYCEPLTLASIATDLHISAYYVSHIFKEAYGISPIRYLAKRRMGEAQTLLMDTDIPVADISDQLGYANPWNFSTSFKKWVGMSPSQYRDSFRKFRRFDQD